jgi:hypothetical protein
VELKLFGLFGSTHKINNLKSKVLQLFIIMIKKKIEIITIATTFFISYHVVSIHIKDRNRRICRRYLQP